MELFFEILEKLTVRTIEYLRTNLQMVDVETNYEIEAKSIVIYKSHTSLIDLTNQLDATVGMSVSDEVAFTMVKNFIFGQVQDDILKELESENLAETLNVTLGNIIKDIDLVKDGAIVDISTPYVPQSKVLKIAPNGTMIVS
ncbi:MAG: chemotaxis protein CheX, partial [Campylobacterales bacterium]|nr:chemotaxis protein CheX [Campylobacterales bacterium]